MLFIQLKNGFRAFIKSPLYAQSTQFSSTNLPLSRMKIAVLIMLKNKHFCEYLLSILMSL